MRGRAIRLGTLLLLLGSIATAESPARAKSVSSLGAGLAAYNAGELKKAEGLLRRATVSEKTARGRATAWLYLGLSQATRKDAVAARRSFARAMRIDPTVPVDRERVPPRVITVFDAVRSTLTGELQVKADRASRVFVNGKPRGASPLRLRLVAGRYRLRLVTRDGRYFFEQTATVIPGRPTLVAARLQPRTGRVQLRMKPTDIRVYRSKRLLSWSPSKPLQLPGGRHRLTFRRPGFADLTHDVKVRPDKTLVLNVRLAPLPRPWYRRRRAWGWITLGLGTASAAVGVLVGRAARSDENEIRDGIAAGSLTTDRYLALSESADSNARLANVFLGVAGGAAITSLILLLVGDPPAATAKVSWRIVPTPTGASVAVRF